MTTIQRGTTVYDRMGRKAEYEAATADGRHIVYRIVGEDDEDGPIYDDSPQIWREVLTERPAQIETHGEREARKRLADLERRISEAHAGLAQARTERQVLDDARKRDAGLDEIIRWRDGELPWFAEKEGRFRIFRPSAGALVEAVLTPGAGRKPAAWTFRAPGDDFWSSSTPGRVFASRDDALAWLAGEVAPTLNDYGLTRLADAHPGIALDDVQLARLTSARITTIRNRLATARRERDSRAAAVEKDEQELRDLGVEP
jgi:hypothetical protein